MENRGRFSWRKIVARPEGVEPPTSWSVAMHSIQLSYGRSVLKFPIRRAEASAKAEAMGANESLIYYIGSPLSIRKKCLAP